MNKVSESIWSNKEFVIPMADVSHVERKFDKDKNFIGGMVITKHSTWNSEIDSYNNSIYLWKDEFEKFVKDWLFYRHEIEGGAEAFK